MARMHLDHISYAAEPDGLAATTERLADRLGEKFLDGGIHPRFGTSNMLLPLTDGQYLEVVEVLDHPSADKVPFGQAVRTRSDAGGGWMGWVVRVDDIGPVEQRLERPAAQGNRTRPDGIELRWKQIGIKGLQADPQLPFFVQWESPFEHHPSAGATGDVSLASIEIAGDRQRVADWLGISPEHKIGSFELEWAAQHGTPGVLAVTLNTPDGPVRI